MVVLLPKKSEIKHKRESRDERPESRSANHLTEFKFFQLATSSISHPSLKIRYRLQLAQLPVTRYPLPNAFCFSRLFVPLRG